jgi:hypothetical protein
MLAVAWASTAKFVQDALEFGIRCELSILNLVDSRMPLACYRRFVRILTASSPKSIYECSGRDIFSVRPREG